MSDMMAHTRINRTLSEAWERLFLQFLARRCPGWMTPDLLSLLGLAGSGITFAGYILARSCSTFVWLASFGLFLNWLGDSLDGTLARYRKIERPIYGYFVDHYLDAISVVLVCLGIGFSGYVRLDIVLLVMSGYLLMNVLVHMNTLAKGVFQISYMGIGPTEIRLALIAGNSSVFFLGNPVVSPEISDFTVCDVILFLNAIALFSTYTLFGAKTALELRSARR